MITSREKRIRKVLDIFYRKKGWLDCEHYKVDCRIFPGKTFSNSYGINYSFVCSLCQKINKKYGGKNE